MYEEQTSLPRTLLHLPMRRLDDVVGSETAYQLLKLDVQGAELDVLKGAGRVLAAVEVVAIEAAVLEYNKGGPLLAEMIDALAAYGFRVFDLFPRPRVLSGVLIQVDMLFLRKDSPLWPKPPFF